MNVPLLQCSPVDPAIMCAERWISSRNGSFYYDDKRQGYCSTVLPGIIGLPVLLDACPFCRRILPGHEGRRAFEKLINPPKLYPGDATCWDESGEGYE